jgi:hypothetical protein
VDDIAIGGLAFQMGRFGRKMLRADRDNERYRARMNAVCDAQAKAMGANIPQPNDATATSGQETGDDEVKVFTDSPVTNTYTTNNYQPPADKSWTKAIITGLIVALVGLLLLLFAINQNQTPPVTPPPSGGNGWGIGVK